MIRLAVIVLALLTFLPIASLLPGGASDPQFMSRTLGWLGGTAICVGVGAVAAILSRSSAERPRSGLVTAAANGWVGWRFAGAVAAVAGVGYVVIGQTVFGGHPLHIDEVTQVWQARLFASGRLSVPTDSIPSLTSLSHIVDLGTQSFSQFPAGGAAMLAIGTLVGAEWLVNPLAGALGVLLFARLLRTLEPTASHRWHQGTVILFAAAPFGAFMFGSHMNHVTTLLWLLVALIALAEVTGSEGASVMWGFLVGLGLGMAATIRPLDGLVFALPIGGWLLVRVSRGRRAVGVLLTAGVGVTLPLAGLFLTNAATTGHPLLFGYDLLWGTNHRLGFHQSPWGFAHTPARGVELISLYLARLSTVLFEAPFPSLLPAFVALWALPRRTGLDLILLICAGGLLTGYGAYWHDGNFLGPRFLVPLLPVAVLWSARIALLPWPWSLRARVGWRWGIGTAVMLMTVELAAIRIPTYRNEFAVLREEYAIRARAAGITNAIVLVKESWGAETMARMWALGIPRSEAEQSYRRTDLCALATAVETLERAGPRGLEAAAVLRSLWVDTNRLVVRPQSVDRTQRMVPGTHYPPSCLTAIRQDQDGVAVYAPLMLVQDGNTYLRYIPGTEAAIVHRAAGRPIYLLRRAGPAIGAPLRFTRLLLR